MEQLEINGDWPSLEGKVVLELLCTEMWRQGQLLEPANVIYLKVDDTWYRHYFDWGIIFWRPEQDPPKEYAMEELDLYVKVTDLAGKFNFSGLVIESVEPTLLPNGSETKFVFSNGSFIVFSSINDVTVYRT
jgi:hypothetical protein